MMNIHDFCSHFTSVHQIGQDKNGPMFKACCPAHNDSDPSLDIKFGDNGKIILKCWSGECDVEKIVKNVGLTLADLVPGGASSVSVQVNGNHSKLDNKKSKQLDSGGLNLPIRALFDYIDEEGNCRYQRIRYDTDVKTDRFRVRRDKNGVWVYDLEGVRRILFHLPQLLTSSKDKWTGLLEGEKDVVTYEKLMGIGFVAITPGSATDKWDPDWSRLFRGKKVLIIADNDAPGRKNAYFKAAQISRFAKEVRIISRLPGVSKGGDLSDWVAAGGTKDQLLAIIEGTRAQRRTSFDDSELQTLDLPEEVMLIPDFLPFGLAFLAGRAKFGKSWLALQIAVAVASGGKFFGQEVTMSGPVLCLALEDTIERISSRRKYHGYSGNLPIHYETSWPDFVKGGGLEQMEEELEEKRESGTPYQLVIIDTFARICGAADQKDPAQMTALLSQLQGLAFEYQISILILDHHPKSVWGDDSSDPISDLINSQAKGAIADHGIGLYKTKDGQFFLKLRGRASAERSIFLDWDDGLKKWKMQALITLPLDIRLGPVEKSVYETIVRLGIVDINAILSYLERGSEEHGNMTKVLQNLMAKSAIERCTADGKPWDGTQRIFYRRGV
jgi:hypothetical protein